MRSLKTSGGLTRGRGIDESQRTIWSLSMPACVSTNHTMQELSGVMQKTGEQNKDMSNARQSRDWKDTSTVVQFLKARNAFECNGNLCNIASGVHAHESVNVDSSKSLEVKFSEKMEGATPAHFSFKRSDQAITLASKNSCQN